MHRLENRGPEASAHREVGDSCTIGFTRLALNGLGSMGMQPMQHRGIHWVCNGEIYNWMELRDRLGLQEAGTSDAQHPSSDPVLGGQHGLMDAVHPSSDCSILGSLWLQLRDDPDAFFRALDGVFALVIIDEERGLVTVGRDPYGVRPLFQVSNERFTWVASEMKALIGLVPGQPIRHVKPGTWMQLQMDGTSLGGRRWYSTPWTKNPFLSYEGIALEAVGTALTAAVRKRLLTERPVAALLSGGVDSSLIAALVQRELRALGKPPLETFTIGFEGSPDLLHAREVADWIGSRHTEIVMTPDDFFEVIPSVIRDIESYDITTVRASVGNWLVSREIRRRSDAKVVFNGDGADEVFGSYLYCFRAPSEEAFESEVGRLLDEIHRYDVLRSDRSISSHGLEPRTPFLDKQFVATVRSVATNLVRPIRGSRPEKYLLRKAFEPLNLLPPSVLWRQKEAFSDGISGAKSWYQEIQERVPEVSDRLYTHVPPLTKEARYYRDLFHEYYGSECNDVIRHFWMPRWSTETTDPSARTLSLYSPTLN